MNFHDQDGCALGSATVMGHEFEWKYWEQEGFVLQWESWSGCFGVASETPLVSVRVIFPVVFGTLKS